MSDRDRRRAAAERHEAERSRILAITRPTPVRLHHAPRWVSQLVRRYLGGKSKGSPLWEIDSAIIGPTLFDHWGSTDGGRVLVSEPYASNGHVNKASQFALALGILWRFSPVSEWNPPLTVRFSFWRPGDEPPKFSQ